MKSTEGHSDQKRLVAAAIEASIRIAVIGGLVFFCFRIIAPFLMLLSWGVIIAVAVYPAYKKMEKALRGRKGLAATAMIIGLLLMLLIPSAFLAKTLIDGIETVAQGLHAGTLRIPPPPEGVSTWPVIGKQLAAVWTMASENVVNVIARYRPEAVEAGEWLLGSAAGGGGAMLLFVASVIIAGVFLGLSEKGTHFANRLATRLAGEQGGDFVKAAESTIRSVAVGVLGIAFIQAVLAGVGMLVAGIPGAGLLAFLCLLLSIMQIGSLPVLAPVAVYMFATGGTLPAVLFSIYAILIGFVDNVLRPLFLGRGAEVPMLVVLLGSLGGLMASGLVGLFVGAVIFTLGYKLFLVWLEGNS